MPTIAPPVNEEKLSTLFEILARIDGTNGPSAMDDRTEHDLIEFVDDCLRSIVRRSTKRTTLEFKQDDLQAVARFRCDRELSEPLDKLLKLYVDYGRETRPQARRELYGRHPTIPQVILTKILPDFLRLYGTYCGTRHWSGTGKIVRELSMKWRAVLRRWDLH